MSMYEGMSRDDLIAEIVRWKSQAAKNATTCVRYFIALKLARQFCLDGRAFHGGVSRDISDWIDGGMTAGLLWPSSPAAQKFLTDEGYSKVNGKIGMRATMTLRSERTQ